MSSHGLMVTSCRQQALGSDSVDAQADLYLHLAQMSICFFKLNIYKQDEYSIWEF